METRYWVIEGSNTGHCCFEYSIIRFNTPQKEPTDSNHDTVAECFTRKYADQICGFFRVIEDGGGDDPPWDRWPIEQEQEEERNGDRV